MVNWLVFTNKMSLVGGNLKFFGKSILNLILIVSCMFFWFVVFTFYQPYQEIAVVIIKFLQVGVGMFIFGGLIHYLFYFINEIIHRKQINKVELKVNLAGKLSSDEN